VVLIIQWLMLEITDNKNGVETYMVDANYTDSGTTEYMGKVANTKMMSMLKKWVM
jgi:hypothetical protein